MKHIYINKILLLIVAFFSIDCAYAQDVVLSQFFANPQELNPAMTGTTVAPKIGLYYRNQWAGLNNAYVSYGANADMFSERYNIGGGIQFLSDIEGDGIYSTQKVGTSLSYHLKVNDDLFVKFGLGGMFVNKRLNWNQLIFSNQLEQFDGYNPTLSSGEGQRNTTIRYADINTGLVVAYQNFYLGTGVFHLTTPNEGILSQSNNDGKLPTRVNVHGGAEIELGNAIRDSKYYISPNFLFSHQGDFNQLNIGAYAGISSFFGGIWFRHTFSNSDAVIVLAGVKYNMFKIGYSFDATISDLGLSSGGTHELSLIINFEESEKFKRKSKAKMYNQCFKIFNK